MTESSQLFTRKDIEEMEKVSRLKLINSLSGFKSANLVGTRSESGIENLAIFSSIVHIGSDPPLLGCILRPKTVPRHTYSNLKSSGWYTLNHVHADIVEAAHQTSGKYRKDISEFEKTNLTTWYSKCCKAPYVKEAVVKMGLKPVEEHFIEANETLLLIGSIEEIFVPGNCMEEDGSLNIEQAGTVTISGLDTYHTTSSLAKLDYVRVKKSLQRNDSE